jgi:hypothetical protein
VATPAEAAEFTTDAVTLDMGGGQCTRMQMVLLLNLDTLGRVHDESAQQGISGMLIDAWIAVTGANRKDVTNITPVILNRVARCVFTTPFNQLKTRVQEMTFPVTLARTGVICA